MKTLACIAFGVALALSSLGARAATSNDALTTMTGKVVSVDVKGGTLQVKVDNGPGDPRDLMFSVTPETKIVKNGNEPVSLGSVKAGDKVTVNAKSANGKNVAVTIGIQPQAT